MYIMECAFRIGEPTETRGASGMQRTSSYAGSVVRSTAESRIRVVSVTSEQTVLKPLRPSFSSQTMPVSPSTTIPQEDTLAVNAGYVSYWGDAKNDLRYDESAQNRKIKDAFDRSASGQREEVPRAGVP